jgi:hypothetical protein
VRRKFLRQNRDLARINSTQSLRIRSLENECSRLLSDNLDLRGQILRLEKEIDDNSAQRVADHALEIKAKLESQLIEWGSLLSTLGLEPPSKRRSIKGRGLAQGKSRQPQRVTQRPLRNVAQDLEALAMHEGRLPPISENKQYQRATMVGEEILALRSEAEANADFPDIGPPPISRFVDETIKRVESPSTHLQPNKAPWKPRSKDPEETKEELSLVNQQLVIPVSPVKPKHIVPAKATLATPIPARSDGSKPSAKRKFGANFEGPSLQNRQPLSVKTDEVIFLKSGREMPKGNSLQELEASQKGVRDRTMQRARKVLSAKSTNEIVASPKKSGKSLVGKVDRVKADMVEEETSREKRPLHTTQSAAREPPVSLPQPVSVIEDVALYINPPSLDDGLNIPNTPERAESVERGTHDTPPPGDISSNGEATRPSRRARAAISYAEPNLRDKMRRPTKELFDAVAGEGKFVGRTSNAHRLEDPVISGQRTGSEPLETLATASSSAISEPSEAATGGSGSIQNGKAAAEALPSSVLMTRRKRVSSAATSDLRSAVDSMPIGQEPFYDLKPVKPAHDVYEFRDSSPTLTDSELAAPQPKNASGMIKASRRSSAALPSQRQQGETVTVDQPLRTGNSRKRTSMAVRSKPRMIEEIDGGGLQTETGEEGRISDGSSAKDRMSRRRSMMI